MATSSNEKIRKLHAEVTELITKERKEMRRLRDEGERAMEEYMARLDNGGAEGELNPYDDPDTAIDDGDIPF